MKLVHLKKGQDMILEEFEQSFFLLLQIAILIYL